MKFLCKYDKKILFSLSIFVCVLGYSQVPTLAIHQDNQKTNLPIHKLSIQVDVIGNISKTTFDVVFFNPYDQILEGSFSFPLNEGQDVCRYALDINGNLREGVVIEKIKARQVYEAVVRQNIDPGILSKTKGNFYKTRIYPIPAKGYKRVVFAVEHILPIVSDELLYELPIEVEEAIGEFSLEVNVVKSVKKPTIKSKKYSDFVFDTASDVYQLKFNREKYKPEETLDFNVPLYNKQEELVYIENHKEQSFFYANFKIPDFKKTSKPAPKRIAIYWDASFSGKKRNIETELKLVQKYIAKLNGKIEVNVKLFNYVNFENKKFTIDTNSAELISYLRNSSYDGATRLETLDFSGDYDEILLFSDGIATIGEGNIKLSNTPVYTFSSFSGSDYSVLNYIAKKTNGKYHKLSENSIDKVIEELNTSAIGYISCDYDSNDFKEIQVSPFATTHNDFSITGISLKKDAILTVNFGNGKDIVWSKKITIDSAPAHSDLIPRVWARFKIGELDLQYHKNKKQITELGKKYNIVTRNTSFIVLDRIEDYVTHEIEPPKELKEEYEKLLALQKDVINKDDQFIAEQNEKYFDGLKKWYDMVVVPKKKEDKRRDLSRSREAVRSSESSRRMAPAIPMDVEETVADEPDFGYEDISETSNSKSKKAISDRKSQPKIKLLAWQPEAPYLDSLRSVSSNKTVSMYNRVKKEYMTTPSFYIEVADFFFKNSQKKQAVKVLTNLLELDLENTELLKVVARRLLDEHVNEIAIEVYKEIVELRPEEPQSYRDLALAYIQNKEYQKGLDLFNQILTTKWDRFDSIREIVLNEMNALISLKGSNMDLSKINKKLINAMPVDIRVVIDWSSNDNDIDLWITDPMGEKCSYSNKNTEIGGKMSTDITGGYGPEEFTLKKAPRGFYTIYVNYFSESRQSIVGPVTVYAKMYTNYGKKNQKIEKIAFQLEKGKKTLQIGQLEF